MKTAIVTGGSSGLLGPVWVEGLRERGYRVDILDLPAWNLVYDRDIEGFLGKYGVAEIIVHNSGIDPKPGTDDGKNPFRRHDKIMRVNHEAVSYMNSLLIPTMIENGGGLIIIIGSIMGYVSANQSNYSDGWTKAFGYNESKAALIMHCHNLNTTYGKYGIRAVMPSFGPYEQGLSPSFMEGFGKKIPVGHPVSKEDLLLTLNYCIDCKSLAGEFRIDGGYTRVGR